MFRSKRKRPSPRNETRVCRWWRGEEPSVDELLADPMVHLVMQRDRIGPDDVLAVLAAIRAHRGGLAPSA